MPIGIAAAAPAPGLIAESHAEQEVRTFDIAGATTIRALPGPRAGPALVKAARHG